MISNLGAYRRWSRFFRKKQKSILVPIDHGLGFGPSKGIDNTRQIASWISNDNIDGIIAHRGILEKLIQHGVTDKALMLQLSGMSVTDSVPNQKELLTSVEYAGLIGADAVSIQSNFDGLNDRNSIQNISRATEMAKKLGFPVLAMIYNAHQQGDEIQLMRHYLRIAVELGVDAVKIPFYREKAIFLDIISDFTEDLDIFIAGGELEKEADLLELVHFAVSQGVVGVAFGRNIFQRDNIDLFLKQIRAKLV